MFVIVTLLNLSCTTCEMSEINDSEGELIAFLYYLMDILEGVK